jgi:hypothetical protein
MVYLPQIFDSRGSENDNFYVTGSSRPKAYIIEEWSIYLWGCLVEILDQLLELFCGFFYQTPQNGRAPHEKLPKSPSHSAPVSDAVKRSQKKELHRLLVCLLS